MKLFWFLDQSSRHGGDPKGYTADASLHGPRWILWITALALVVLSLWAYFAEIDQITRAPGTVIASSRSQIIQSQEGGTLENLIVKEGDIVKEGAVLATLERTKAESSFLEARAKVAGLRATVARLKAEVFGGQPDFPKELDNYPEFRTSQMSLFRKRQAAIEEEIASLKQIMALAQEELEMNQPLLKSGDVSQTDVLRLRRQVADLSSQITNKRNKYFQDAQAELNKVQEDLAGVEQTLAQRSNVLEQTELKTPLKGVVKNVRITTRGGVIRPGEEVMQIVPLEDDLLIEAKVDPVDIAFIKVGQDASVKIDAYDYTLYGSLNGKLVFISADTLTEDLKQGEKPYYRARVQTSGRQFSARPEQALDILPGMTATVEVKTGSNTVWHYLTKPITKTLRESMGER
ncbi:HlyD family type I secretion periplasmic adaptor subunit [Candidatus Kaiserbacteria bacterium]|nr:HlyD family type I secretion periplasmic adaptor subunit [Candidatus Kaiserbacteria bacterium]